jgi:cell division topological specificity factor
MRVVNLFRRPGTAPVARDRLQILLSHERAARDQPDLVAIAKHVAVERDNIQVRMDRGATVTTVEIGVDIPHSAGILRAVGS